MSGQDMLAGLQGAMTGYEWGQKIMGSDPETRKLRAEEEKLRLSAEANQQKADQKRFQWQADYAQKQDAQDALNNYRAGSLAETINYHGRTDENADLDRGLRTQQWNSQAPYREAQLKELQGKLDERQSNQDFRDRAFKNLDLYQRVTGRQASPEEADQFAKTYLPWAVQDAEVSKQKLGSLMAQAGSLLQQGKAKDADSLFSTPEGRDALAGAYGPMIAANVGQPADPDGNFVITANRPAGVIRSQDGKSLAMSLEVTAEPSEAYKKAIMENPNIPDDQKQASLAPKTYNAPLTEGRVPGGTPKWFTPTDFQKGMQTLDYLARAQKENPQDFEDLRGQLAAMASGGTPSKGLAAALNYQTKTQELRLRERDLKRKEEWAKNKGAGKDPTGSLVREWEHYNGRMLPGQNDTRDPEVVQAIRDKIARRQILGADIIRNTKGNISLEEVNRQVDERMPLPKSEEELHSMVGNIIAGSGGQPAASPAGEMERLKQNPVFQAIDKMNLTPEQKLKMLEQKGLISG